MAAKDQSIEYIVEREHGKIKVQVYSVSIHVEEARLTNLFLLARLVRFPESLMEPVQIQARN